jgi:asparagine synthase (glutamine-hydrolysing)
MGAFALLRGVGPDAVRAAAEVDNLFQRQGFRERRTIRLAGWTLVLCRKVQVPHDNLHFVDPENFAFATGTFIYRDAVGAPALARYHKDAIHETIDWDSAWGSYFIVTGTRDGLRAHLDPLGSYKVFSATDGAFHSSSFLAAAHLAKSRTLDSRGIYQYVFEGATFGSRTIFKEIQLFPSGVVADLDRSAIVPIATGIVAKFDRAASPEQHIERTVDTLRRQFRTLVGVFGDRIDTALSGGYDSRLILALLLEQQCKPRIHVYGRVDDADVRIAQAIAKGEAFRLEVVDKSTQPRVSPDEFPALVERNFYAFDGTPNDGILDNGADLKSRLARCAGGEAMLNGGGGEIFRNFFYLRDRPFTVREFLWSFYTQFDPQVGTEAFSEAGYHRTLSDDLRQTVGTDNDPLERPLIELLYPIFRCRFWAGRNTSINNRFGHALTPFIESAVVRSALPTPLELKEHGAFEAALIARISPALAAYRSDYGHDFRSPVPWRRRVKDWTTLFRPPLLRRYSFRVKQRLRSATLPYFLTLPYRDALDVGRFPEMSRFFRMDQVRDPQQLNRICTLEFLCRIYRPKT